MKSKKDKANPKRKTASSPSINSFKTKKYFREILFAACAFLFIRGMIKYIDGYDWLFHQLISENQKAQAQFADSSMEKRLEGKIGFSFSYLNFIKKNTPEDAVIVMPVDTEFFPKGEPSHFDKNINTLGWASYFVYPRRLVSANEPHTSLFKKATHMAFVNKYGYERLPYKVDKPYRYAILPIHTKTKK